MSAKAHDLIDWTTGAALIAGSFAVAYLLATEAIRYFTLRLSLAVLNIILGG